jgi:hypothetical protein
MLAEVPLLQTARLGLTDYFNDSCALDALGYAIEPGATGATSNPWIALEDLGRERAHWVPRVLELARANPAWNETELAWAVNEPAGLGPAEFDGYAPTVRTLRTYTAATRDLAAAIRDIMLPDPQPRA